ncbi:glycogenin glucosyltransferase glg1 [Xenoophorus captivus]|uniref:Glycogenin glucosyltransferase glg1 n=1 Tax=Xenoophorus captivus TaxID=1517983 RepID=A0ABV0R0S8_9TELE
MRSGVDVQDYKVSYSLAKACKSDLRKYRCNMDTNMPRARETRLSYLLLCLEAAVHRGELLLSGSTWICCYICCCPEVSDQLHCLVMLGSASDVFPCAQLQALIQEADPGADYRIDRALNEACESVIQTACKHIRTGDPMILSCLMEHLYTEKMVEDCEHRLLELQYFIARDWK